jgi:serine/threonine protein kinase
MPSLPLVGQDFAGYRLRAVLGRGGMSVVYEAENARLGNTIALKVLAPELSTDDAFRARFLKESRLAASLNHPNVIPIYDTGPCEDLLYIAMRYVAGSDLRTVLDARERISPGQALLLIGQAGRALDAAHRLGLVHRDVKPANVLIERGAEGDPDHVYIADFGLTKHTLSRSGLTETGQLLGTIDYIAPEQIQGKDVDGRADIYSLGCVLYECLTGRVPFVKDVDAAVIWAHVEEPPTPPSAIRPELAGGIDEVIMCAMAKDPNDRYATCREFVGAAHAALEAVPQTSTSSDVDIAAGPPTVLSGRSVQEPAVPGPPTVLSAPSVDAPARADAPAASTASSPQFAAGGSDGVPPAAQEAGVERSPGTAGSDREPVVAPTAGREPVVAPAAGREPVVAGGPEPVLAREVAASPPAREQSPPAPPPPGKPDTSGRGARRRRPWYAAALVALVGGAAAVVLLTSSSSSPPAGELSSSTLGQVPTNHVTGSGDATVRLNGNMATVTVTTKGLDNNDALVHAMHIHAGGKGECPPASAARLHNGHRTISTTDGINYYGPPAVALTTTGDTGPGNILAFPRFLTGGTLRYDRTIPVPPAVVAELQRNHAVIVVHGIDYDGSGIYSGVLERSELNKSVPATATAPALCGVLVAQPKAATLNPRSRGRGLLYTASLVDSAVPISELFLCETGEVTSTVSATRRRASSKAAA